MKKYFIKLSFFVLGAISFFLGRYTGIVNSNLFVQNLKAGGILNISLKDNSIDVEQINPANESGSLLVMRSGVPVWEKYFIDSDLTLYVPTDFNTVSEAMSYLHSKFIAPNAIVTIQVEDGVYNFSSQINLYHPDGNQIKILGNITDPSRVIFNFNGSHGFSLSQSSVINLIDGFTLIGDDTCNCRGVNINKNSFISIGNNMVIRDFQYGVIVNNNSFGEVGGLVTSNFYAGIVAQQNSYIKLKNGPLITENDYGVLSNKKSTIEAGTATANNNTSRGFSAWLFGTITAQSVSVSGNGVDFVPAHDTEGNTESYIR